VRVIDSHELSRLLVRQYRKSSTNQEDIMWTLFVVEPRHAPP
jgi:hypothetical protein